MYLYLGDSDFRFQRLFLFFHGSSRILGRGPTLNKVIHLSKPLAHVLDKANYSTITEDLNAFFREFKALDPGRSIE